MEKDVCRLMFVRWHPHFGVACARVTVKQPVVAKYGRGRARSRRRSGFGRAQHQRSTQICDKLLRCQQLGSAESTLFVMQRMQLIKLYVPIPFPGKRISCNRHAALAQSMCARGRALPALPHPSYQHMLPLVTQQIVACPCSSLIFNSGVYPERHA
jgi:hypothetical protein